MIARLLCRLFSSRSARKANRAKLLDEAAKAERVASAQDAWNREKARFIAAKARGDTRRQGEAIANLTRANCELLRAERAYSDVRRAVQG